MSIAPFYNVGYRTYTNIRCGGTPILPTCFPKTISGPFSMT